MSVLADQQRTQRQNWAAPLGRHDRLIGFLRFIMPVSIGILLALLTFSPFSANSELSFLLDKGKVQMATERMKITEALYRGEDSKGRPFSLKAGSAVQKSSAEPIIRMNDLSARILLPEGPAIMQAINGVYNLDTQNIRVVGPLSFATADGYSLVANDIGLNIKDQLVTGQGVMNGRAPSGYSAGTAGATFSLRDQMLQSPGQLSFRDKSGLVVTGSNVRANLQSRFVTSAGPVNGRNNVGEFKANSMTADLKGRVITLKGNAHLHIDQNGIK
jgi:lipopolysaccharide export system protein LptC